ncbi:MAG: multidrug effflux MFS transporter [Steroidobacteraceae bacterium]
MQSTARVPVGRIILVLGLLTAFGPFATDMYLSGFGAIARSLRTDIDQVQLSLSTFFLGLCIGQLFYGPLIDAFGRRGPLLLGVSLFIVASLAAALAPDIGTFITVRFVQAVGGCAGVVVSRALIHDLMDQREAARALSLMMIVQSVGPIVAPVLGAYILTVGSWRAIFAFLVVLGLACVIAAYRVIPETLSVERRSPLALGSVLGAYRQLLGNRQFIIPTLASSIALSQVFAFISGSPFVYMTLHGVSQQQYGFLFAMNALSLVFASQLNRLLLKRVAPPAVFAWSLVANLCATGLLLALASSTSLVALMIPLLLAIATLPLVGANGVVLAMSAGSQRAGSASSIIGVLQYGLASLVSALVGLLHNGTAYPMCGLMFGGAALGSLIFFLGRQRVLVTTPA